MSQETEKECVRLYEGMYIISATLSEDARGKALQRIESGITSRSGEIVKVHDWGKKRLAYDVNGHREGHYFILYFNAPSSVIKELWKEYHLNEDLVRFTTLRAEEVMEEIEFKPLSEEGR